MSNPNEEKRPLGAPVPGWTPPPYPEAPVLEGRYARLEALDADAHAALLFKAFQGHDALWDYMPDGPFASASQFHRRVRENANDPGLVFYAIRDKDHGAGGGASNGQIGGMASYLRIAPEAGSIELGYITLGPSLQGTRAATEAFFLMMDWAFSNGYRRFEWKCNALNMASRRAAQRLGLSYEGVFRQAAVVKGRNRDTAWFAAIDREWPALKEAFAVWLRPENFGATGAQIERLSDLTSLVRVASDPAL